jgi:hypothetical protein
MRYVALRNPPYPPYPCVINVLCVPCLAAGRGGAFSVKRRGVEALGAANPRAGVMSSPLAHHEPFSRLCKEIDKKLGKCKVLDILRG